jgi:hypothetical protein
MKYLFLDIDGVMNHEQWLHLAYKQKLPSPEFWFDPVCVDRLNRILSETGAKLVISSSWRSDPNLKEQFAKVGLPTEFDCTINLFKSHFLGYTIRGEEIDHYLKEHGVDIHSKHQYVILDDDNDFTPWQRKNTLFRAAATPFDEPYKRNEGSGLTEYLTEQIIKYLSYESKLH